MPVQRRLTAISCFAVRILYGQPYRPTSKCTDDMNSVIGSSIAQLVLIQRYWTASDPTLAAWSPSIAAQFTQCLSVVTACIPYIRSVLVGMESGMFQTGHFHLDTLRKASHNPEPPVSSSDQATLVRVGRYSGSQGNGSELQSYRGAVEGFDVQSTEDILPLPDSCQRIARNEAWQP